MRKQIAAGVCAAVLAGVGASGALAGEITGPPGGGGSWTPPHFEVAASLCSFSGLNDFVQGQTQSIAQNWGQDIVLGIAGQEGPPPGIGCNPTRNS